MNTEDQELSAEEQRIEDLNGQIRSERKKHGELLVNQARGLGIMDYLDEYDFLNRVPFDEDGGLRKELQARIDEARDAERHRR